MATNTINVKANGYASTTAYQFRITANFTGNIQNNTREVEIIFDTFAHQPGGYKSYSSPRAYIYITEEGGSETNYATEKVKNIWPRDEWVEMARYVGYFDGGQTITIKGRYNSGSTVNYMPLNGNHDVSITLEIPNTASRITSTSSLSYTVGDNISLGVSKYISNSVDTLTIKYTDSNSNNITLFSSNNYTNGDILSPIAASLQDILEDTTQVSQIDLVATLKTYVDNVQIGEDSVLNFKGTLPNDIIINSIEITDEDPNVVALTGDYSVIVKNMSDVSVNINYSLSHEGEIDYFIVNGISSIQRIIWLHPENNNNSTISVAAYSKRGFISSKSIDLIAENKWVNYQKPTINIASLKRNTPVDGNVNVQLNGTWFNGNFGQANNAISLHYRYKKSTDSTWSNWVALGSATADGNTYSLNEQISGFNYAYIWNFEFAIKDAYYTGYTIKTLGNIQKGVTIWDIGEHDVAFRVPINAKDGINVDGAITGPNATTSQQGLMSAIDKLYMENFINNNYIVDDNLTSGSLTNGYYLLFANGLAVCWWQETINVAVNSAWGGGYLSNDVTLSNFPFTFTAVPLVLKSLDNGNYAGSISGANSVPASTTNPGSVKIFRGSSAVAQDYKVNIFAIGFWNGGVSI